MPVLPDRNDVEAGARADFAFGQRLPVEPLGRLLHEELRALTYDDQFATAHHGDHGLDGERPMAEREVRAGAVNRLEVPVVADAADDVSRVAEFAAVDRQEGVGGVVVGGEDDGASRIDARRLHGLEVRGIADHHAICHSRECLSETHVAVEDRDGRPAIAQRECDGLAHVAPPDDEDWRFAALVDDEEGVELRDLFFRAYHHRDAVIREHRVGSCGEQPAAFPDRHDVEAGQLPQAAVAYRTPGERRAVDRELGDHQLPKGPDSLRRPDAVGDAGRQMFPESLLQGEHLSGSAQLDHIDRVDVLGQGEDRDRGGDLAHGQCDVRVLGVVQVRDDEARLGGVHGYEGGRVVARADHHRQRVCVEPRRLYGIGLDDHIGNLELREAWNQPACQLVVATDHDMAGQIVGHLSRRLGAKLSFEPGRIEEANESEWRHDQQHYDPVEQDHDREDAAEVAVERDVSETERAHHRERPVEPGEPRVLLALGDHDDVKQHGEDADRHPD